MKICKLKLTFLAILFLGLFGWAESSEAANHYVRQGASGNGSDWASAYGSLPTSLIRGDTYYVADGSYSTYTFDDALSGTSVITIKKATIADHGTGASWQASYGDGQAIFNSVLSFNRGYYVFDGQVRDENDWFNGNAYGFRVSHNNQDQNIRIGGDYGSPSNNITIKYAYVDAIYGNLPDTTIRRYAVDTDHYDDGFTSTGLVFQRMYIYGSNQHWFLRTTNGAIVEYSASKGISSNAANHGNLVNLYYSGNNAIIRYNKIRDAFVGSAGTSIVSIVYAGGLEFYGNTVWNFSTGDGAIGYSDYTSNNNKVYNNTFAGGVGWNAGVVYGSGSTGNSAYNNLFINNNVVGFVGVTHNYNGFSDSDARGEANAQVNIPTSIFTNYSNGGFTLTSATSPGTALSPPYNLDMTGTARGADGTWDRGAYEYGSAPPSDTTPPAAPQGLTAN